jgi:hypothetical protein
MKLQAVIRVLLVLLVNFVFAQHGDAQFAAGWNAVFIVQPYPSPYISDWQNNPSIASLTVINGTRAQQRVVISIMISDSKGKQIISGSSDPILLMPGSNLFNNTTVLHGNLSYYDAGTKSQIVQTGRAPEGSYSACVTITNVDGVNLISNLCANFTIVYPDPPHLVFPTNGDSVTTIYPVFQWTPLQVPIGYQLHYVLKMAEILPGQTPLQALAANVPQYENDNLIANTLQYPISALPLKSGATYVWQIQALDQNGFPPSSNNGKSEVWTFTYKKLSPFVFHPVPPVKPPSRPLSHFVFLTNSTISGTVYGTFNQPSMGIVLNQHQTNPTFPLANATIELVAKYMLIEKGSGKSVVRFGTQVEKSVPRYDLPLDHKFDDADQVVATTTTDPSGNFSMSFLELDSTGLVAQNQTINFGGGEFPDYHSGDLYKVYRIMVQNSYFCSPDDDIIIQPYETENVGSLLALVRTYSLKVTVVPSSYQGVNQITQAPLGGSYVYLLRQSRPAGVPDSEGFPKPAVPETINGLQVVAETQANQNGVAVFSNLVKNIGPNDQYFIYAKTDPKSQYLYFCFPSSFQFNYQLQLGQTLNYQVTPNNAYSDYATFNSEYVIPTVSISKTMIPLLPRIAGFVYRKDNPNVPVSGAQVQSLTYALLFWNTENSQPTLSNGEFSFDVLTPTYDNSGNLVGPLRALSITKYGYKTLSFAVNNGAPLKLGQQAYYEKLLLEPAANVSGNVVDELGNPIEANVTVGEGATITANKPTFIMSKSGSQRGYSNSMKINYSTGFQCPAILGVQKIIIDPTPFDETFFPDTEYVNITKDGQDLGTFVVKKKLHRIMVLVSIAGNYISVLPIKDAHVNIQNVGNLFTDTRGIADTTFVSSSDSFKIKITAPDGADYEGQTISAYVPETKDWTIIHVGLKRASHISGKVFAGTVPIPGAHVFLDQSQSPDAPTVETYTNSSGQYVLHCLPIGSSVTILAAKSQSNYIGDSKTITVSASGKDTLNFNLKVYNDMDITRLMGFPIEVTSLNTNGNNVSISGNIISLPSNGVFSPADSNTKVPFHNISIIPGTQKDSNNIPYAVPKTLPLVTDVNSLQLKIYGTMVGSQSNDNIGIGISDAGNGVGQFVDLTYIDAASFTSDPAFSNVKFPGDRLYLELPAIQNVTTSLNIPTLIASGVTPSVVQNGFHVSDAKGNSLHYTLYGFEAVADSNLSVIEGDTVRLLTTIHTNLSNVSNPDINFKIGNVVLHSKKFEPIKGNDSVVIALEKWKLVGNQWAISQSGGFMINTGQLITGTINVPFTGLQVTPTDFKYGSFQSDSISLAGILPLAITGQLFFGFDVGKGHWSLSVAPKGGNNSAAYLADLPGTAVNDKISINNFYLLSNGDQGLTIDNTTPPITYYRVTTFTPTMLNVYSTYVEISGTMDIHVPELQAQSCAIDYSKSNGILNSKLVPFPFSFDAAGVHLAFTADQSHPETLDVKGFYAKGTISEPGKYSLDVWLYRTPDSTSVWTVPGQTLNISQSGARRLANIVGSMNVNNGTWRNFWFAGDMTGTNGATGRVTFVVYGDIVANNQQIGVKNISTPFGDISFTYDFQRHVLLGTLNIKKDLSGGASIEGTGNALVDEDGWYFDAGAKLKLKSPKVDAMAALVFGDHPMDDDIKTLVKQYSWVYKHKNNLPSEFPATVSGFYFEGEVDVPIPVIPSFDFNFGIVSAKLWANVGGDLRLAMTFAGDANTYDAGVDLFADVGAGVGASIGIACAGVQAEVLADVALDGQYQSTGDWYVDGSATLTLSGSAYCGFGLCDSDCGGLCDKEEASASVTVGVNGHYGTDYKKVEFVLKGGFQ